MKKLFLAIFTSFLVAHVGLFASFAPESLEGYKLDESDTYYIFTTESLMDEHDVEEGEVRPGRTYTYEKTSDNVGIFTKPYEGGSDSYTLEFTSSTAGVITNDSNRLFTLENIVPDPVTVVSDPNGNSIVVQVGDEYNWDNSFDGVILWSVEWESGEVPDPYTYYYIDGRNTGDIGFHDSISDPAPYDKPYVVDENGYLKVNESSFQYYNVVSVEDGVIGTIQDDEGVDAVADNGTNIVDQWFFTTREAAEAFYNSKINYAPNSLLGQKLRINEVGYTTYDYFFTSEDAYFWDTTLGTPKLKGIPYTYEKNSSAEASLFLNQDFGIVAHQITFASFLEASSTWEDNVSGIGSIQVLPDEYAPDSLVGWKLEAGTNGTYQFTTSTDAIFYYMDDTNYSNSELSNITYTWEIVGPGMGKLTTDLDEVTWLFFETETTGYFYWEELEADSGASGEFSLLYYSDGHAHESLAGHSLSLGTTRYVFSSDTSVTIHSQQGPIISEYAYLRNGDNEGILSIGDSIFQLDFNSSGYGRVEEGGSGYFQILSNWAAKGWVYYDDLPWIYSNNQGDWMYQFLSENNATNDTELMYFEPWSNQWSQNLDLNFTDQRVFSVDSEYYWEDYDDFNGTELNSSKWDVAWWDGAQPGNIDNGKLTLSGTGNSYSPAQVNPQGADAVIAKMFEYIENDEDESPNMHSFAQVISGEIHGISAKIMIPNDAPVETGIGIVGFQFNPDGTKYSMDIELGYWFEGGPLELGFENEDPPVGEGAEVSNYEYVLGEWVDVSIIHTPTLGYLMLNDEVVLEFETTYNPNWYGFYAFNDQDPDWKEYKTYVDNVRVLRKKNYPQGWMWTDYYPWVYSHETGEWLYFELAKDTDGNPVMNYYDHKTGSWDLYGPSLIQLYER